MKNGYKISIIFFLLGLSCGSKPTLQLNLSGTAAFSDNNVQDIVFIIQNVPTSAGGLDQDHDGTADTFVYPEDCGASLPAGCGFSAQAGEITVGELPLNFKYKVTVRLRSNSGATLHTGNTTFDNLDNSQTVNLVVN